MFLLSGSKQTSEELNEAKHVRQQLEEIRSNPARIAHETLWMNNIAALLGYNSASYSPAIRQFINTDRIGGAVRNNALYSNKVLPTVQNRLARLCKNPPKYDVRPNSDSNDDKDAARLALQTLMCQWDRLHLDKKRLSLYMWLQQCGHAYVKTSWDPLLGDIMKDPLTGETDFEGDVLAEIFSPFEVFPNPKAASDDEMYRSYCITAKVRSLEYFRETYEKGHEVKEEETWLLSLQYEERINNMNTRGTSSNTPGQMKNSAIEIVKYEARTRKYPNGRMIVVANNIKLEEKELPIGEIPLTKFDDVLIGGKYYSESIITHLRPIQDYYNQIINRRAQWAKKFLAGKYRVYRGAKMSEESPSNGSSEIMMVDQLPNGAEPVQKLDVPALPQWAYQEEESANSMFNDISGISEVARGSIPSASIPAIGMQLLVEQDDTRIGVITEQHEHAWARVGRHILKFTELGYKLPRKLKMAGPQMSYAVKEISGDMLKGHTDVIVIRGSTLPGSKTLRRQEILNLYSQGLLGPLGEPSTVEKVLSLLEFGDVQGAWADFALDMNQIKRGMESLKEGIPVEVNEADNHALWFQELNRFRKSEGFNELPPEVQALIMQTMDAHMMEIARLSGAMPPEEPTPDEILAASPVAEGAEFAAAMPEGMPANV